MVSKKIKILIPLAVFIFTVLIFFINIFSVWREKAIDLLITGKKLIPNVVIVAVDEDSINKVGAWPFRRSIYANLIQNLYGAKVIGIDVNFKEKSLYGEVDDNIFLNSILESTVPVVLSSEIGERKNILIYDNFKNLNSGFSNLEVSKDGVVRRFVLNKYNKNSFASSILKDNYDFTNLKSKSNRIYFYGPQNTFTYFSFSDVIEGRVNKKFFEDKIILIGATALDLQDFRNTPVGVLSGVEIHANIIQSIIDDNIFKESLSWNLIFIFLSVFLISYFVFYIKKIKNLILISFLFFSSINLAIFLFVDYFIILDIFIINVSFIASIISSFITRYIFNMREKMFIKDSFSKYISPKVIEELLINPQNLKLGGEKKKITILFSDIRGFTTLSESIPPDVFVPFLNSYLSLMTNIILKNNGLVDKYIGDAIMAFWGAPLRDDDQIFNALKTAEEMNLALLKFNEENIKKGLPKIEIGIGINTGEAVVGNLGSEIRFDYTAIGDSVNLASRLESLSKYYGAMIMVGEDTKKETENLDFIFRELDTVKVKGKKTGVKIFELLQEIQNKDYLEIKKYFENGLSAYYKGDWVMAKTNFEAVLVLREDLTTKLLLERVKYFINNKVDDWDGVYEMKNK